MGRDRRRPRNVAASNAKLTGRRHGWRHTDMLIPTKKNSGFSKAGTTGRTLPAALCVLQHGSRARAAAFSPGVGVHEPQLHRCARPHVAFGKTQLLVGDVSGVVDVFGGLEDRICYGQLSLGGYVAGWRAAAGPVPN